MARIRNQILRQPEEASLLVSGAVAFCATIVVHRFVLLPLRDHPMAVKVLSCGWVAWAIGLLGAWSLCILLMKAYHVQRSRRLLADDLLPATVASEISAQTAPAFLGHLFFRFGDLQAHPLLRRLEGSLREIAADRLASQVVEHLRDHARRDNENAVMGYTIVRTFVWAIPILGFIGTVSGIGQAIGGFSESLESAQDLAVIKAGLGQVVHGLAFAFNTTLIGLFVSLMLVIPMGMLQRAEHAYLSALEGYCSTHLLRRLCVVKEAEAS